MRSTGESIELRRLRAKSASLSRVCDVSDLSICDRVCVFAVLQSLESKTSKHVESN